MAATKQRERKRGTTEYNKEGRGSRMENSRSGVAKNAEQRLCDLIEQHPRKTTTELAAIAGISRQRISKIVRSLHLKGLIRKIYWPITGRIEIWPKTWNENLIK